METICDCRYGSSGLLMWPKAQNQSFPSGGLGYLVCKSWWLSRTPPEAPAGSDALPWAAASDALPWAAAWTSRTLILE